MRHLVICGLLLSAACSPALADGYFGFDLMGMQYENAFIRSSASADLTAVQARLGKRLNDNFSIEGRIGLSIADGDYDHYRNGKPFDVQIKVPYLAGAYVNAILPFNDIFSVHGTLGLTAVKTEAAFVNTITGASYTDSESGTELSYGGGVAIRLSPKASINADYMMLMDSDEVTLSTTNIGFTITY